MRDLLIMRKTIDLASSPILYQREFTDASFAEDWDVRSGEWHVADGACWGTNPLPQPGCILSRKEFPGNVLIDCFAATVKPSTHDINVMWNAAWNDATNTRGMAYVAGIQGWWSGKVGIEKSPEYKLVAATPSPWFEPEHEYHIQVGSVDGHCFVFVNDELKLELIDPDPINNHRFTRIGFEAFQSKVRISRLTVRQIVWHARNEQYTAEF
ncbi:MAG TPA: hypothetical protein VHV83_21945 [Armatimonadota bacterium]|nr:hypothetical protein [Armatimonadota bacterium]